jgi:diguanylate cyclase (GGDEF)-like protein
MKLSTPRLRWHRWLLVLVGAAILASAWITGRSLAEVVAVQRQLDRATTTARAVEQVQRLMLDAETGQRGFLLVGRVGYLEPYHGALKQLQVARERLVRLVDDAPSQPLLASLDQAIDAALAQMAQSVALRAADQTAEVQAQLESDAGKRLMDDVRHAANALASQQEDAVHDLRQQHAEGITRSLATTGLSFFANVALLAMLVARAGSAAREAQRGAARAEQQNEELAQLLAQSSAQNRHMQSLSEMGRFLQSCRDGDEATAVLSQRLPALMQASHGALYLMAASRNQLRLSFSWGGERFVELLEPQECWALRSGQAFQQPAEGGVTSCAHLHHGSLGPQPGMLCLPMAAHGELSGLLVIAPAPLPVGQSAEATSRLRQTALEQVALSLGNLALRESLRQQSIRDPLTGLVNRRYLDEALPRELLRAERRGQEGAEGSMAVLMVDVDHFKRFNDEHGHELGDRVLRNVAQVLGKNIRASDLAARYGGEEFTVVVPELAPEAVLARAEALRAAVEALPPSTEGRVHGPVTISVGVAVYPHDGQSPEALLARADEALYAAKRAGRNRVVRAGPGLPPT